MDVAAAAVHAVGVLRHERRHGAGPREHLLGRALEQHAAVGGFEGAGIAQVHLVHALAVLAVVALDLDAVGVHLAAQPADDLIVDAGVADRVAVEAGVERAKVAVVLRAQALLIFAEDAELEFDGHLRVEAHAARARSSTRRSTVRGETSTRLAVLVVDIAHDGGRAGSHGTMRNVARSGRRRMSAKPVSAVPMARCCR